MRSASLLPTRKMCESETAHTSLAVQRRTAFTGVMGAHRTSHRMAQHAPVAWGLLGGKLTGCAANFS